MVFGHYADYTVWPFQAVGVFVVLLISCVFAIGLKKPDVYQTIASKNEKDWSKDKEEKIRTSYIEMSHEKNCPISA